MPRLATLLHALRSDAVRCLCGSDEVFVRHGFFGKVGISIGFTRYACRRCRRRFWLRKSLRHRHVSVPRDGADGGISASLPEPSVLDAVLPAPPKRKQTVQPKWPPPDLSELDAQLDEARKKPQPKNGAKAAGASESAE